MSADTTTRPDPASRLLRVISHQHAEMTALTSAAQSRQERLTSMMGSLRRDDAVAGDLERLVGVDQVRDWLADHSAGVRREAVAMSPGGGQQESTLARGRPLDEAALARGVRLRTLYLTSATRAPATRRHVQELAESGAEARTLASLPLRMVLLDDDVALLPLRVDESHLGAFVVRTPATLTALRELFEVSWARALPFGLSQPAADLTDQERAALRLLATGAQDQDVAAALGVSERTARRMFSSLSERLGARSRFQAGVYAVRSRWLD